jgi:hypothetical protein
MSAELDEIKAKIVETEADLKQAKVDKDRDMILTLNHALAKQQKKKNLILAGLGNSHNRPS